MQFASPLFWIIILFLVILVWFDGVAAGKDLSSTEGKANKPSLWQRGGRFFKRMFKNPTPASVVGLFIVLLLVRLLIGLLPLLLFLAAAWVAR